MNISDTPLRLVQKWTQMIPGCYDTLDSASSDMECPTGCIPIGLAMSLLVNKGLSQSEASSIAAELVACYTWRQRTRQNFRLTLCCIPHILVFTSKLP